MVNFKKKKKLTSRWHRFAACSYTFGHTLNNRRQYAGFLALKEKGLRSTTLLALRYRDEMNDWNYKLKKVRKPLQELITGLSSGSEDSESV